MTDKKNVVEFKQMAYKVETQAAAITDESIVEAKRLIGVDLRGGRSTVEITKEMIQSLCNRIDCFNPLYLDEEYAKNTRWGGIIAPPYLLGGGAVDYGLRGVQSYHCGDDWEWFQVTRPGDVLISRCKPVDAKEHQGRRAARMIEQITKREVRNQQGELVCLNWHHVMRIPRATATGGLRYEPRIQKWSDEELAKIRAEMNDQKVRGDVPRYWEDTKEGEEMAPIVLPPLRGADMAFGGGGGGGRGEHGGAFAYHIIHRREHPADTYINPVTGAQEEPHRGHFEAWMARQIGMPGRYDVGTTVPLMVRYVCDWMGDDAFLKKCWVRLRRPRLVADAIWGHGKVVRKWLEGENHLVECETYLQDQTGDKTTVTGRVVVMLPSRASGLPCVPIAH